MAYHQAVEKAPSTLVLVARCSCSFFRTRFTNTDHDPARPASETFLNSLKRRLVPFALLVTVAVVAALARPGWAQSTLEKVGRNGTLTIGTRTGSPPFAYVNKNNEWVGFSIDLVEQFIIPALSKKTGKTIKLEKKESAPQTRIPLLTSNAVDLIAETMTDTQSRRDSVDFSITYFVTGAQFLVKKGSPVKGIKSIGGMRIAAQQGSTNARIIRERVPTARLLEFPDQPAAFQALVQGQVQAYTNDGIQLAGLKVKAPKPDDWVVVGEFYSYEPYGMAMRKNDSDFRQVINVALMDAIESGKYFELYDKWFGAKGEVPYPLAPETKRFLQMQVVPK
jgi:ABC-type amino acid transport substrate-binding protein